MKEDINVNAVSQIVFAPAHESISWELRNPSVGVSCMYVVYICEFPWVQWNWDDKFNIRREMFATHEKLAQRTGKNKPDRSEYLKLLVEEVKTTPSLGMKSKYVHCITIMKVVLYLL